MGNEWVIRSRKRRRKGSKKALNLPVKPVPSGSQHTGSLLLDLLEARVLLSVENSLSGSTVSFDGLSSGNDTAYIKTQLDASTGDYDVLWSSDGDSFTHDLDSSVSGDQTLSLTPGAGGTLTLSGSDVTLVLNDLTLPGIGLNVQGPVIEVDAGATISTVLLGNGVETAAGDVTFEDATSITLSDGSVLDAGTASITFSAEDLEQASLGTISVSSSIDLTNATITGGDVSITTDSQTDTKFDSDGDALPSFLVDISGFAKKFSIGGGFAKATVDSTITVSGGSINADTLTLNATASALAATEVFTAIAAVGYAQADPTATISIEDGAQIVTVNDFDASTFSTVDIEATAKQALTNFFAHSVEKYNFALAIGKGDLVSTTFVSSDSSIESGGAVNVTADGDKIVDVEADAAAGREGVAGLGIGISDVTSTVDAQVDGTVTAAGDVRIVADLLSEKNTTRGSAEVGISRPVRKPRSSWWAVWPVRLAA